MSVGAIAWVKAGGDRQPAHPPRRRADVDVDYLLSKLDLAWDIHDNMEKECP